MLCLRAMDKRQRRGNNSAMADDLTPRISRGEGRRITGSCLFVLGVLLLLGGRPWSDLGAAIMAAGGALYMWGSLLGWLRVIEERQIALQRALRTQPAVPADRQNPWGSAPPG
jgi:hypothetical protein